MLSRLAPKFSLSLPLQFAESYFPLQVIGFSKKLLLPNTQKQQSLLQKLGFSKQLFQRAINQMAFLVFCRLNYMLNHTRQHCRVPQYSKFVFKTNQILQHKVVQSERCDHLITGYFVLLCLPYAMQSPNGLRFCLEHYKHKGTEL